MKFTLRYIFESRYDINRSQERKLTERFIPLNILVKFLSPYPTWVFLNIGIHQDSITFLSLAVIFAGAILFILGQPLAGALALLFFGLLDSVDGDMARVLKERLSRSTSYGGVLDSFGADFFYALIPVSLGYHLFSLNIKIDWLSPAQILLIAALVSVTFLLYRLVNAKASSFSDYLKLQKGVSKSIGEVVREKVSSNFLSSIIAFYKHPIIRGNFFSEAGMIFWFSILVFFKLYILLTWYLLIILIYNIGYLLLSFVSAYIYFVRADKN